MDLSLLVSACFLLLASLVQGATLPGSEAPLPETPDTAFEESDGQDEGSVFIVGGAAIQPYSRPYLLQLSNAGDRPIQRVFCGAAAVNESWALTAAHCVVDLLDNFGNLRVTAAEHDVTTTEGHEQRRKVTKVVVHKKYESGSENRDIALLKLDAPLDLSTGKAGLVQYLGRDKKCPKAGETCRVMGWGTLSSGGRQPDVPHEVEVPRVSGKNCRARYPQEDITRFMICFGEATGGKDSCQGDSGGPLVCECDGDTYHVGIVSWGYGCASARYPGVYTNTYAFRNWIRKCIAKDGKCARL